MAKYTPAGALGWARGAGAVGPTAADGADGRGVGGRCRRELALRYGALGEVERRLTPDCRRDERAATVAEASGLCAVRLLHVGAAVDVVHDMDAERRQRGAFGR